MLKISVSGIKKIEALTKKDSAIISLSQGAMRLGGIPQQIKKYVQDLMLTNKSDYYEHHCGISLLRERLSTILSNQYNSTIEKDQIIITHGCIGGLSILFLTLLQEGDEVIIPEPAYPAYKNLADVSRATVKYVSCLENSKDLTWSLDPEKIKQATTDKTKIIIFSNPCNPTGMVVPQETILELVDWCEKKGIYLVIDEAYIDYCFRGEFLSGLQLVSKSEFVVSANSFSKNMAMSGWRIGYLVTPKKIASHLAAMQDAILNSLNNISQYAALFAIDHPEFVTRFFDKIKVGLAATESLLQPVVDAGILKYSQPAGSFFLFLKTNQRDDERLCLEILKKAKVGLVPGSHFGPTGKSFARLCFAREKDVLEEGLSRLNKFFLTDEVL
jgi:aminotransferase